MFLRVPKWGPVPILLHFLALFAKGTAPKKDGFFEGAPKNPHLKEEDLKMHGAPSVKMGAFGLCKQHTHAWAP
jgi:hypothetical protein